MRVGGLIADISVCTLSAVASVVVLSQEKQTNQNVIKVVYIALLTIGAIVYRRINAQINQAYVVNSKKLNDERKEIAEKISKLDGKDPKRDELIEQHDAKVKGLDVMHKALLKKQSNLRDRTLLVVTVGAVSAIALSATAWANGKTAQRWIDISVFVRRALHACCSRFSWLTSNVRRVISQATTKSSPETKAATEGNTPVKKVVKEVLETVVKGSGVSGGEAVAK